MHLIKIVSSRMYSLSKNECKDFLERKKENDNFSDFEKRRFWVEPNADGPSYVVLDNTACQCEIVFLSSFYHAVAYMLGLENLLSEDG